VSVVFNRTTGPISTGCNMNNPLGKGIQVGSIEGGALLRGEKIAKRTNILKNILQNKIAYFNQTWYKPSLVESKLSLFKKGQVLLEGEIVTKIGWGLLKIFFSRTNETEKLKFT
jgi:hypothetical protein